MSKLRLIPELALRAAVLYLAYKYADDFEGAVVANTNVGGENCHRGSALGALMVRVHQSLNRIIASSSLIRNYTPLPETHRATLRGRAQLSASRASQRVIWTGCMRRRR